jgi:hypothetical protein
VLFNGRQLFTYEMLVADRVRGAWGELPGACFQPYMGNQPHDGWATKTRRKLQRSHFFFVSSWPLMHLVTQMQLKALERFRPGHGYPQHSPSRAIVAPTRLSGVEAPDVSPIVTAPSGGSHGDVVTSAFDPIGRWRISVGESRHSGSAM